MQCLPASEKNTPKYQSVKMRKKEKIMILENYLKVEERVQAACERAGRSRDEVTLIAVSKTKPDEMVEELVSGGVRDFGENKPQELMRKHDELCLKAGLNWHMIGNIQTNKVKMIVGRACLIHSVPSLHTAQAISKQAEKLVLSGAASADFKAHILIEVNIADEETKHGASIADKKELEEHVLEIAELPFISVDGLMAIAPPADDPEENRHYFRALRELRDEIQKTCRLQNIENAPLTELSMGMTGDFEVAIEEGATFVRVGTAIFGERIYT